MLFSTSMDIPSAQQLKVTGYPNNSLIKYICSKTNTLISFPVFSGGNSSAKMFYFCGSAKSVLLARKYLQVNTSFYFQFLVF